MRKIRRQNSNIKLILIVLFALTVYIIWLLNTGGISNNFSILLIDTFILIFSFFIFLFFFSIFIFPFQEIRDLFSVFYRVLLFIAGKHGFISHVNSGVKTDKYMASIKSNPGLILLDSASAAIIGNPTGFHRAVGPGVIFTDKNEVLADTVDLQIQKEIIGPLEGENPYSEKLKFEKPDSYFSRIQRASETRAITRDGITIVATFSITFKIKSKQGEGKSPFGYDPLSVERAILSQTINIKGEQWNGDPKSWTTLPGLLAIDIWREMIHKYRMNELFQVNGSNLVFCLENIYSRLTNQQYEAVDEFGNRTGKFVPSSEYQLLENRGIDFVEIQLIKISLPPEIEDGLVDQWESSWLKISDIEQTSISRLRDLAIADGKKSGKKIFAGMISLIINKLASEEILTPKNLIDQMLASYKNQSKKVSIHQENPLLKGKKDLS